MLHGAYCQVKEKISTIRSKFNYNMQNKNDDTNLQSKSSHSKKYGMITLMIILVTEVL